MGETRNLLHGVDIEDLTPVEITGPLVVLKVKGITDRGNIVSG